MAVPNPYYKANWEEVYDFHDAERKRLDAEISANQNRRNELYNTDTSFASDEMKALLEEHDALYKDCEIHDDECRRCIDTYQHETIQDVAKWYFEQAGTNMGLRGQGVVHQIDYDTFQTIEEVRETWSRARDVSKQIEVEKYNSLKIGEPDGSDIFTDTVENQIASSWQVFNASNIGYNPGSMPDWHSHTLVTVDQREGEYHICFMHDPDTYRGGGAPMNYIEALASTMYRRAVELHKMEKQPALPSNEKGFSVRGFLSSIMWRATEFVNQEGKPRPDQFSFYVHARAQPTMPEIFCRVDMQFDGNGFREPNFKHFDVIPEALQKVYYETTMPTVIPKDAMRLEGF